MTPAESGRTDPAFRDSLDRAYAWARQREFRGHDPYDALLSPLLARAHHRLGRGFGILVTQLNRRLPVNLRQVLGISPGVNPKALALFLSATSRRGSHEDVEVLAGRLNAHASRGYPHACWGYDFPWRSRSFLLPAGTPTVVVTSFAGEALLDAHAAGGNAEHLRTALSACDFVTRSLHRTEDATGACLSYSPLDRTSVYNASVLGARLLVLAGQRAGRPDLVEAARPLVRYVLARQGPDGSWSYGDAAHQRWVDSFHTGFVLCALDVFRRATSDPAAESAVRRGATFFDERFFGPDGAPYYYPAREYPLDIHSAAQGVLTFLQLRDFFPHFAERARTAGRWMVRNLLDPAGQFHYQIRRTHRVRIPYMRWSQAWGVRALAELVRCGLEP